MEYTLGQSREQFLGAVPIHFAHRGSELLYESVTRRAATLAELKRLRVAWPNEKQGYYDVTTTVRATFKANRLVDLYVRRIESY